MNDLLLAAQLQVEAGRSVIPVGPDKRPLTPWKELQTRLPTVEELRSWFDGPTPHGLAVICGNGLAVLDIDDLQLAGAVGQSELAESYFAVRTPSGGLHLYLRETGPPSQSGPLIAGVADLKATGGYVVAPPTPGYERVCQGAYMQVENARDYASRLLASHGLVMAQNLATPRDDLRLLPEGIRNVSLTSHAGLMRRQGFNQEAITAALYSLNQLATPPLPDREVDRIVKSIARYDPATDDEHLTDLGNARRLVELHGDSIRYCRALGGWLIWDGTRWSRDETGEVYRLAKLTIRTMYATASRIEDSEDREKYVKHVLRSEARGRIEAIVGLAATEPEIARAAGEFDSDPMLLNCLNGTLDLANGQLRPHHPADLITKLAPVEFQHDVASQDWDRFLRRVVPDPLVRDFLQKAVGYALTGLASEEKLFFIHGPGATGKTTFLEAIKETLGEYALTSNFETFLKRREGGGPRNDIARLAGARFVAATEVDEGKEFAEGLVKLLTGNEKLTARFLYREEFEFRPTFKLFLAANKKPSVSAADDAIWRRVLLIPFETQIPEAERDPNVKARLRDPAASGAAILSWALEGCLTWTRTGLQPPVAVRAATQAYRNEMDLLGDFYEAMCVLEPNKKVAASTLYETYKRWAASMGLKDYEVWSQTRFGRQVSQQLRKAKEGNVHFYYGIGLRPWEDWMPDRGAEPGQ